MTRTPPPARGRTVQALRRQLDGRHAATRDRVRDLLATPPFAPPQGLDGPEHRAWVLDRARDIATAGDVGPSMGFPTELGGRGDVAAGIVAFEQLAQGDLSLLVKVGVQFGLFGGAILQLGTARHHAEHIPPMLSLELPGCFAMTEDAHGSDVQGLRTTATYDPATDELVVTTPTDADHKTYIGNAGLHGRLAVVFAQLVVGGESHGVHAVLVPIRDGRNRACPGVRIEDNGAKLGLNGVDNGKLWFDDVRVPRGNLLDRYGQITDDRRYTSPIEDPNRRFFTMLGTLVQGRVSVGGAATSATKVAQTIAVRHAESRRQFRAGGPEADEVTLLDYRVHQRRLLPDIARTYALSFAQQELVEEHAAAFGPKADPDGDRRALEAHAAGLKALQTRHATDTIQACREACGGAGYMAANRFAALKADTDVFTTFEGDNTVLLQLVAKDLLTAYGKKVGGFGPFEMAAFVVSQVAEQVVDRTSARAIAARVEELLAGDDAEAVRDRDWQIGMLRDREEHLVASLARRLKGRLDDGVAPFDAFNAVQDHALAAAESHVERRVLEAFARAIERCRDRGARELLERVCDLHALSVIEAEKAWYLEHDRLTTGRSKCVSKQVNVLCGELRASAAALVDAFAIPEQALGAPIAGVAPGTPPLRAVA